MCIEKVKDNLIEIARECAAGIATTPPDVSTRYQDTHPGQGVLSMVHAPNGSRFIVLPPEAQAWNCRPLGMSA